MTRTKVLNGITLLLGFLFALVSDTANGQVNANDIQLNTITTAVPFLLIAPDARHSG